MGNLEQLLDLLWRDFAEINPQAGRIHDLLEARGELVMNDHIALRTFAHDALNISALAAPFEFFGYDPKGEYSFPEKGLRARHYEHSDAERPKIFISELVLDGFTEGFRRIVSELIRSIPPGLPSKWNFSVVGRPWVIDYGTYEKLRAESEYAAWMSAFGFRANHFTVSANRLSTFASLQELNGFLKQHGFRLNDAGGEIKGSPQEFLEQSSTLAEPVSVRFADGEREIPGCYYEFARRYPLADGSLFQGFIAQSADRIFESTDRKGA